MYAFGFSRVEVLERDTENWIYSHLLMGKYDANAVQMCGKHGKSRIYSHIYKPYVKVK